MTTIMKKKLERIIHVSLEESEILLFEGHKFIIKDKIFDKYQRIEFEYEDSLDQAVAALEFIRNHTKGYGNVHEAEFVGLQPKKVVVYQLGFSQLIELHKACFEQKITFSAQTDVGERSKYHVLSYSIHKKVIDGLLSEDGMII